MRQQPKKGIIDLVTVVIFLLGSLIPLLPEKYYDNVVTGWLCFTVILLGGKGFFFR
jgi:hypothetical protein